MKPLNEYRPVPKPTKETRPTTKQVETFVKNKATAIKKRSTKRAKQEREYARLAKEFLASKLYCEAKLEGCRVVANQCHHIEGRQGALLTDPNNLLAICDPCHAWITEHSAEAIKMGLSISRLHNTHL